MLQGCNDLLGTLTDAGSEAELLEPVEELVVLELEEALEDQLLEDVRPLLLAEKKLSEELRLRLSGLSVVAFPTSMILAWPRTPGRRRRFLRLDMSPLRHCIPLLGVSATSLSLRADTFIMLELVVGILEGDVCSGEAGGPSLRTERKESVSGARRELNDRPRRTLACDTPDHVPTW